MNREKETRMVASLHHAMEEEAFVHENGLITKAEVRAVTLAKLHLESDHVLWDLGAGSGSVAIEASLFIRTGRIIAVEKNPARVAMIRENKARFGVENLSVECCRIVERLADLPRPNRVFVGGGGRELPEILIAAAKRLLPDGRIVCNAVVIENMQAALSTMEELDLKPEIVQLQVSRGHALPHGNILKPQTPVWILSGTGKGTGEQYE